MKPFFVSVAAFLIVASFALANAEEVPANNTDESSINPDSFFWGIENALDRISLALTFNDKARAEKGLEIARERLSEFEKMAREGKVDAAEKAKESHDEFILKAKSAAKEIRDDNKTREIEQQIEIEQEVEKQGDRIEKTKIKIKTEGNLTAEQKALIDSLIASMQNQTGSLKIEIEKNKEKIKIEIKQKTNRSEAEIEEEIEGIERAHNITEIKSGKALETINDAKEELAKLEAKIAANNVTDNAVLTLRDNAKAKIAEAESAYTSSKFGEAYGLANAAEHLAENAREKAEKLAEERQHENENETRNETEDNHGGICIQVITPAKNKATGECKDFPTPCDVPEGWEKADSCTGGTSADNSGKEEIARSAKIEEQFELFNESLQDAKRCKELNISVVAGGCILQKISYDKRYIIELDSRMAEVGNSTCWVNKIHRFMAIKKGEFEVETEGTCGYNKVYKINIS